MAKRQVPLGAERPEHSIAEKKQDILLLKRRVEDLEKFDPKSIVSRFSDPQVEALKRGILDTLTKVYGHGSVEYSRYKAAANLDNGPVVMGSSWVFPDRGHDDDRQLNEAYRYLSEGKSRSIALLNQAVKSLEEEIEFSVDDSIRYEVELSTTKFEPSKRIFIVHGHDDGVREMVARYLEKIGFNPLVLHEQANRSLTVIEKVEEYSDVDFAIVLLTPDDDGCKIGEPVEPRVRQNVLLELGYFIGKLGRSKVCVLVRGEVAIPSDFCGVMAEKIDSGGGWRQILARELQAVGHKINWNLVMQ